MHLAELMADCEEVHLDAALAAVDVAGLAYDSRRVQPGWLFAAWSGQQADGHAFVPEAVARGASVILCERDIDSGAVPALRVARVRRTLAQAARRFYGDPSAALRSVAVTGTSGKTTTVHLIESILQVAGLAPGMIGTLGSRYAGRSAEGQLTTPESTDLVALLAEMRAAGCKSFAMEASSQALDQERVFGARFDVAAFTNLSRDHLDYHGDFDTYFAAKARLFDAHMKPSGVVISNMDDVYGAKISAPRLLTYSARGAATAQVRLIDAQVTSEGNHLRIRTPRGELTLHSPLLGRFNLDNVLAAVAVGVALDIEDASIVRGVGALARVPGRLERVSTPAEPLVLVDYSHKPDALIKALDTVREVTSGRLLCVFGCGGDRDATKRAPMGEAVARGADWAVLTNDNPRTEDPKSIAAAIEAGLQAGGARRTAQASSNGYCVELDRRRAIALAVSAAAPQDTVLIAGKGHETYQIIGREKFPFDDRREARAALDAQRKVET